jgi:putative endonuclease
MKGGWVYIMTNKQHGVLDIGVTGDLASRLHQHRTGRGSAFCHRYGLGECVHVEEFEVIDDAIAREKSLKAWKRTWKIELIDQTNPDWHDLVGGIA